MSTNLFGKAFNGIFGPGSPIIDEPTIDYNDTINTFKTNPSRDYTTRTNFTDSTNFSNYTNSSRNNRYRANTPMRGSSYVFDDSDDDLNEDMSYVYNRFNENSTKLSGNSGKFDIRSSYEVPGTFNSYDRSATPKDGLGVPVRDRFGGGDKFVRNKDVFAVDSKYDEIRRRSPNKPEAIPKYTNRTNSIRGEYMESNGTKLGGIESKFDRLNGERYKFDPKYRTETRYSPDKRYNSIDTKYNSTDTKNLYDTKYPKSAPEYYSDPIRPFEEENRFKSRQNYSSKYTIPDRFKTNTPIRNRSSVPIYEDIHSSKLSREAQNAKEVIKLEQELNKESITKLNTKYNELTDKLKQFKQLNTLNDEVKENNQVLRQINELIDVNNDKDLKVHDNDYDKLRAEYLDELKSHQFFYQNYVKLFDRYKNVKELSRRDHNKIREIRTKGDERVRKLCDELLKESQDV